MRQISNFQWLLILAVAAFVVFIVGVTSLYINLNLPHLLPKDINDSDWSWAFWAFWAVHTPLILILSRRFSFERRRLTKSLLIYLSVGIVWAMIVQGLALLALPVLHDSMSYTGVRFYRLARNWFGSTFLPNLLMYWLVLSVNLIFLYYERYQKEMLKASTLDAQLSNARLQTLKMQLHPHFLFNTLHSISALVLKNENRDAVKMINRLSELLRLALDNIETQVVSLEDEIEFTRRYLEIEQIRFHDRLSVEWDVEPQTLEAEVPTLILQPLVENAMRHGVDSNPEESRIQIAARRQNDRLLIEVRDDGKDLEKISGHDGAAGLGLKNTRARLSELYGEDYSFSLSRREGDWTIAQIVIPFVRAQELPPQGEMN
jgi:two-component system LytT family sensor kinase